MKTSFRDKPIRVQIVKGDGRYIKTGQFAYIISASDEGGAYLSDDLKSRPSKPGEIAYLVSKTKNMVGGALWFSEAAVRPTSRTKKK